MKLICFSFCVWVLCSTRDFVCGCCAQPGMCRSLYLALLLAPLCSVSFSPFHLASIFSENIVLQRAPASARVWGWTLPSSAVAVRLNCTASHGSVYAANVTSDASGLWVAELPPQPGSATPCYASFTDAASGNAVWYLNWRFGEVLLCLGQSNMDLPVSYIINGSQYIADSPHYGPYLSLFALPLSAFSTVAAAQPQADLLAFRPWAPASPEAVQVFSAECYLVALGLFEGTKAAEGVAVPFGAIMSDWPGASITQLVAPSVLAACDAGEGRGAAPAQQAHQALGYPGPIPGPGPPSSQWNAMVAPLTVGPLAVNNFVLHQSEADVHGWYDPAHVNNLTDAEVISWYSCRLRGAIADFRGSLGGLPGAWFGVSQLNPYAGDCAGNNGCSHVAAMRYAQLSVANSTPACTAGVIPDLGDPWAPAGSVHSRRKVELAQRLVAGALTVRYGAAPGRAHYGPTLASAQEASTAGSLAARLQFEAGSCAGGLQVVGGVNGTSWCPVGASPTAPTLDLCGFYELQGSLSGWVNASLTLEGPATALLTAPTALGAGDRVVATRGYWNAYPVATLFGGNGLPAVPWLMQVGA